MRAREYRRRMQALEAQIGERLRRLPQTSDVLAKLGFGPTAKAGEVAAELGMTPLELRAELERIARG